MANYWRVFHNNINALYLGPLSSIHFRRSQVKHYKRTFDKKLSKIKHIYNKYQYFFLYFIAFDYTNS